MKLSFNENSLYFVLIIVLLFYIGFNWAYNKNAFPNYQSEVSLDGVITLDLYTLGHPTAVLQMTKISIIIF